jgi:hypothetical protein
MRIFKTASELIGKTPLLELSNIENDKLSMNAIRIFFSVFI